jgi:hypothetical protein
MKQHVSIREEASRQGAAAARELPRIVTLPLRLEGIALIAASIGLYVAAGADWVPFVILLILPDLSIAAYLRGPVVGAIIYNVVHNWALAGLLIALGFMLGQSMLFDAGAALTAHVGLDRLLGYGLKYPTRFQDTHLGWIGRGG